MSPNNLLQFCKKKAKEVLGSYLIIHAYQNARSRRGIALSWIFFWLTSQFNSFPMPFRKTSGPTWKGQVTSGECGRSMAAANAIQHMCGLLDKGCVVLVTSRTCLSQLCSVFDDDEERTSHFLLVSRIWKQKRKTRGSRHGGGGGRSQSGRSRGGKQEEEVEVKEDGGEQVFVELLDPACTLDDDVKQAAHISKHGVQPNPNASTAQTTTKKQGSTKSKAQAQAKAKAKSTVDRIKSSKTRPTQVPPPTPSRACRALSLVKGQWRAKAGQYIVDWKAFDLAWNSNPDGKDRWWLALHPTT